VRSAGACCVNEEIWQLDSKKACARVTMTLSPAFAFWSPLAFASCKAKLLLYYTKMMLTACLFSDPSYAAATAQLGTVTKCAKK